MSSTPSFCWYALVCGGMRLFSVTEPQGHSNAANREPSSKFGSLGHPCSPQNRALPDTVLWKECTKFEPTHFYFEMEHPRVRNSGCPVVQDNQKSSRTTKDSSLEHFSCPYGQPRLSPKQYCHLTRWHTPYHDTRHTANMAKLVASYQLTLIMSAVMGVWLLTMLCGRNTVFKF